jgi:hypothetical protein
MVLIYGRGHSELVRRIYGERFLKEYFPMHEPL